MASSISDRRLDGAWGRVLDVQAHPRDRRARRRRPSAEIDPADPQLGGEVPGEVLGDREVGRLHLEKELEGRPVGQRAGPVGARGPRHEKSERRRRRGQASHPRATQGHRAERPEERGPWG